MYLILMCFP